MDKLAKKIPIYAAMLLVVLRLAEFMMEKGNISWFIRGTISRNNKTTPCNILIIWCELTLWATSLPSLTHSVPHSPLHQLHWPRLFYAVWYGLSAGLAKQGHLIQECDNLFTQTNNKPNTCFKAVHYGTAKHNYSRCGDSQ